MGDAKKEPNYSPVKIRNFRHIFFQNILRLKIKRAKVFLATVTLFFLCTFNLQGAAWAVDGDLDTTFGTDGKVTTDIGSGTDVANSVVVQSDGKIVVAGYSGSSIAVVRYNPDGLLDGSFGADGIETTTVGIESAANSVVLQSDGKILVAGQSYNVSNFDFVVVRYNSDGSLDSSFDTDGIVTTAIGSGTDVASSVVVQSDGKILVAGYSSIGNFDFVVVRYNADGSLDRSFDSDGIRILDLSGLSDVARSVILQSDGKIVVTGQSSNGNDDEFAVVRFNSDGSLDGSFDNDGIEITPIGFSDDVPRSVVLQSDGKIVVAGYSNNGSGNDFAVVRYNSDGSLDGTFDTDGKQTTPIGSSGAANSVVLQSDGKIVAAGNAVIGGWDKFAIVRYNPDGSIDSSFGTAGTRTTAIGSRSDIAKSVVVQSDGNIVAAGYSNNGSNDDFAVVRYSVTIISTDANFNSSPWVGVQSIVCPDPNPWTKEQLVFSTNVKPVLVSAENTVGKTITQSSYVSLKSSGVEFDTDSKEVSTATETLPIYGCKDKLLSGKVNQPIQFIAGGYSLQSEAHGYIKTADLKWHDTNGVTLYTNTAAFLHTVNFTKSGKYVVVLTEQPDTGRGLIPTYGVRSIRFVININ
jgi:uncharacterized delta-60 repeat protein